MRKQEGATRSWLRHPRTWLATGLVVTVAAGVVVGVSGPASADPATTYVAVGSDTIQDIMDQFATSVGSGAVGSWDAVNPGNNVAHEVINPKPGCSMTRPNGSGEGLAALRKSINPATGATQLADAPEQNCVDIGRSSSGPGGNASTTGDLVYIPFALDAVATATGPAATVGGADPASATAITNADLFTSADLTALYACNSITEGGVTYVPDGTVTDATHQPIHMYVPQPGSGTRNFWATTFSFNATTLPGCVHDHSVVTNAAVEEHDGTVYATDPDGLGPFSAAQFIAQSNGHHDRRHNAAIHNIDGVSPKTAGGTLNTAYPVRREVYNIVKISRITSGSADFDPNLTALLSGATSKLCGLSLQIHSFGFATLESAPLGHTCGQIATNLRAFAPGTV